MLKLSVLLLAGVAMGQPWRGMYGSWKERSRYSPYSMPLQHRTLPASYQYMEDPMARVMAAPVEMDKQNYFEKMVGEQFFKQQDNSEEEDSEELPYILLNKYGGYEEREYPAAKFACVKSEVDIAQDPFAGLRKVNPFAAMSSKRWKKSPSSIMFKELFKYISGVNKENEEIEMTRPVSTHHSIKQKKFGGNIEVQEMCFYIPAEHQESPPEPLTTSPVYVYERPTMRVFVRRFGGFALSSDDWLKEKNILENLIIGKPHHNDEYYTNGYNSPFILKNRRNEVWIQSVNPGAPVIAAVTAEEEDEDEGFQGIVSDTIDNIDSKTN